MSNRSARQKHTYRAAELKSADSYAALKRHQSFQPTDARHLDPAAALYLRNERARHALGRAKERYGVEMTYAELAELSAGLRTAAAKPNAIYVGIPLNRSAPQANIWLVMFKGKPMVAAYNVHSGTIVTFLPIDAHELVMVDGRFVNLVNGGSPAAREFFKAITS